MRELLKEVESEIESRSIDSDEVSEIISSIPHLMKRRVISGYASVAMVDRENQKISISALREAVKRFMADDRYRIISIFHSDACVGRVLPKWTDPNTGETYETEVDNVGWKVIVELRDDIELANKVWDEIIKGNLRSFSVAGTSKQKHHTTTGGNPYTEIDEMDILEVTVCLPENEKIWTKRGLIPIKDVSTDDFVFTHKGRWKKVTKVMKREVDEEILEIITFDGSLTATAEHPVRAKNKWIPMKDLKIGDTVSTFVQIELFSHPNEPRLKKEEMKIVGIEKFHYEGMVYNLEVEEDNSYTTSSIVVHNCSIPVNPMSMFSVLYNPQESKI